MLKARENDNFKALGFAFQEEIRFVKEITKREEREEDEFESAQLFLKYWNQEAFSSMFAIGSIFFGLTYYTIKENGFETTYDVDYLYSAQSVSLWMCSIFNFSYCVFLTRDIHRSPLFNLDSL